MANSLLIEKQTGGYFKFTLNGDTANAITSIQNDLLAVGNQLHFKTGNGANIIKEQFIYPEDITIISGGTFTFTTVAQVWDKLIDIDYFAWLGGGGSIGIDRFDDLVDTFKYTGNAGKTVVVDNSELRLIPITLYNKRLFTELEDTPSSLVPDKMVVVNPAGTALILKDQPEPPEEYLNSVGYFDYNDLITQTTPLNAVANVALKLTNDTEGANTSTDQNPYGVSYVWDYTTNQFNFNELEVGDTIDVRVHVQVTTTSANQRVLLSAKFGIGSVVEFTNIIYENQFKTAGLHEVNFVAPFYMGSTDITDYPAELYLTTDASATVKVGGWYVRILRKNINIITVDYTVPDATTTVKGIVRLAGDLSGTANSPTVPELANKVPTSRTVSTTSPLLGGGALSSNLTLSIQQANSVDSGYLSYVDWNTFNNKASDSNVVHLTGAETITGLKTFSADLNISDLYINGYSGTSGRLSLKQANSAGFSGIGYTTINALGTSTLVLNFRQSDGTNKTMQISANLIGSVQRGFQFPDADGTVALTSDLHSAVTLVTANGLSLSGQALSLGLASTSSTGALSSTDWTTFNGKQTALSGTGFVKISGTTISYDNSTYALDSAVVKLAGAQTVTGLKTFSNMPILSAASSVDGQIVYADANNQLKTITNFKYNDTTGVITTLLGNLGSNAYTSTAYQPLLTNPITGTGITNYLPKFIGSTVLGNSSIYDNGTGAVGIGVVPSNWDSAWKALQVSDASFIGNADELLISHNLYKIGEDTKYISSSRYGSLYSQNSGAHWFATAPIGTAGANATLTTRMILTNDGKLGIGTTSPAGKLSVIGDVIIGQYSDSVTNNLDIRTNKALFTISPDGVTNGNGTIISYSWANGGQGPLKFSSASGVVMTLTASGTVNATSLGTGLVYSNGGTLTNTNPSDSRLKEDITDLQYGLNEILKLRPVSYNWKNDNINQGKQFGFIAQEVQEVMPELVKEFETEDGERLGLDKEGIYAALVNAIKELKAEIEILKNK